MYMKHSYSITLKIYSTLVGKETTTETQTHGVFMRIIYNSEQFIRDGITTSDYQCSQRSTSAEYHTVPTVNTVPWESVCRITLL